MSNNEKNETTEFDFSNEIENPIEIDTSSISESVKTFTGLENTHSMEEMECYEDEETEETTKVATDTSQIIHRKGNSGVIPNLELLPTDSIRIPTDEIAETIVVPERMIVSNSHLDEIYDKESAVAEDHGEEPVEETHDREFAEDDSCNDETLEGTEDEESAEEAVVSEDVPKKVHQDIELLPEDEIDDDVPVSKEEADALGDLSYHDEDVKKTNKDKAGEKHSAGRKEDRNTRDNKTVV